MDPKCSAAIRAAANGRQITDAKLATIEAALSGKMREMARGNGDAAEQARWRGLSRMERVNEAAAALQADVKAEAARNKALAAMQAQATVETTARIDNLKTLSAQKVTQSQALTRDIENTNNYVHTVRDDAIKGMTDLLDAAASTDGTGFLRKWGIRIFNLDNPQMTADIVREVFKGADGHTGNALAKTAARAWLDTIEPMRVRFNAAGGNIGKLGYGYLSQIHDAVKIAKVTAQEWAREVLPLLDRRQYLNADGTLADDAGMLKLLEGVHKTLASNGLNKIEPGQYMGAGKRANSGSDARVLHFADGDAWIGYMQKFGEGSLYDAMMGHVGHMARNIGLVERYGPNPEQQFRLQNDIAERADPAGSVKNRSWGTRPQSRWDMLSGKTGTPINQIAAWTGQTVRNVQTAAKLGGAVITSITDMGTLAATLHYDRLPYFDMLKNIGKQFDKDQRAFLTSHGIIAEHLASSLNRWTGDHLTHSLFGRVAQSVMKLSFMNAWTDGLRSAFSATMMQNFSKKLGKTWAQLDEWDRFIMGRKGITEADWDIISKAKATVHDGAKYLTGDAVRAVGDVGAEQAATKWMAFVSDEAQTAIINPDMATRALVTGGGAPAGTIRGEFARTAMQFKSFPVAMLTRHWGRIFDTPQGLDGAPMGYGAKTQAGATINRLAVLAGLNVSLMMLGAMVLQIKALMGGKDPYDMTEGKFWTRAFAQGGGSGYLGDLLTKDPTERRSGSFEQATGAIGGPGFGAAAGLLGDLLFTNAWEAATGQETHAVAETVRWVNSQLPYSSLWQTRGLYEHWFLHNLQEAVNPGYLSRMQQRARKDWGQGYYWKPGELVPDRAPDMANAVGG